MHKTFRNKIFNNKSRNKKLIVMCNLLLRLQDLRKNNNNNYKSKKLKKLNNKILLILKRKHKLK